MGDIVRVAIMDDHPPIIEGYISRLRTCPRISVVGTTSRGEALEPMLASIPVDVLILDVVVPISDRNRSPYPILFTIPRLLQLYPEMAILVISMHNQPTLIRSMVEVGVNGYILKDDPYFLQDLPHIVETVAHGGVYFSQHAHLRLLKRDDIQPQLTARQLETLSLCAAYPEATTADLAKKLQVAHSTVRNLLSAAYLVLDVHSRTAAIAKAQRLGLIPPLISSISISDLEGNVE